MRPATRLVARRAAALIAVSDYLRRELETKVPEARGKTEVVPSGVDLQRFRVAQALKSIENALILLDSSPAEGVEISALERVRDDLGVVLRELTR